jgi:hypothetical protein
MWGIVARPHAIDEPEAFSLRRTFEANAEKVRSQGSAMTQDNWTGSGIGNWTTDDWSLGSPPTNSEDAFIGSGTGGLVVSNANETVNSIGVSTNYTLDINSGTTLTATLGTGSGSLSISGTIAVGNASAFEVDSSVVNSGVIELQSTGGNTNFYLAVGAFVTLSGGGDVEMDGASGHSNFIAGLGAGGEEFTNEDNDISGTGTIFGEIFTNDGIIETNNSFGAGTLNIWGSAGSTGSSFDNEGSMFVDPGGTMILGLDVSPTSQIGNDGFIQFLGTSTNAATMEIQGNLTIVSVGGRIELDGPDSANDFIKSDASAASLTLDGGTLEGAGTVGDANLTLNLDPGTLVNANTGGGQLIFNTGSNHISVASGATMEATAGGTLIIDGVLDNSGTVTAGSFGTVAIAGTVADTGGTVSIGANGILDMSGDGTVAGVATFTGVAARLYIQSFTDQITGGIAGMIFGDSIDLQFQTYSVGDMCVWQQSGATGTLSLETSGGTVLQSLTLTGQYGTSSFKAVGDGVSGTLIEMTTPAHAHFHDNGPSDILFRDAATGDTGFYAISNGVTSWHDITGSSTAYSVVGVGDFHGNGTDDVLYRDNANGDTGFYNIVNGANTGWHDVGASSTAYGVVGVGDFTGSGTDDILYRDTANGDTGYYAISNGANTGWHDIGASSTAYSVVGVGDFYGNGIGDVLYRDNATGDTGFYSIVNGVNAGWVDVGASSTAYSVVGVGDFLGNGIDDILYRDNATGDTGFYAINNGINTGWHDIGASSTAYSVVGTGDYLGTGTADVLFRNNTTGDTGFYAISNGVNTGWHDVAASSTAYHVVG